MKLGFLAHAFDRFLAFSLWISLVLGGEVLPLVFLYFIPPINSPGSLVRIVLLGWVMYECGKVAFKCPPWRTSLWHDSSIFKEANPDE